MLERAGYSHGFRICRRSDPILGMTARDTNLSFVHSLSIFAGAALAAVDSDFLNYRVPVNMKGAHDLLPGYLILGRLL